MFQLLPSEASKSTVRYRRPHNMGPTYATAMLKAGVNHLLCAKWLGGAQDDREMQPLEAVLLSTLLPQETESGT